MSNTSGLQVVYRMVRINVLLYKWANRKVNFISCTEPWRNKSKILILIEEKGIVHSALKWVKQYLILNFYHQNYMIATVLNIGQQDFTHSVCLFFIEYYTGRPISGAKLVKGLFGLIIFLVVDRWVCILIWVNLLSNVIRGILNLSWLTIFLNIIILMLRSYKLIHKTGLCISSCFLTYDLYYVHSNKWRELVRSFY